MNLQESDEENNGNSQKSDVDATIKLKSDNITLDRVVQAIRELRDAYDEILSAKDKNIAIEEEKDSVEKECSKDREFGHE